MSRFSELALCAEKLEEVLKGAYVGMVPCGSIGQFDSRTEQWEKKISDITAQIRLLTTKSLLVKATLHNNAIEDGDNNLGETSVVASLSETVTSCVTWRRMLRTLAMCRAASEIYGDRESKREECLIIDELSAKLFKQQQKLDMLEEMEAKKMQELYKAQEDWRRCGEEYSVKSRINYMAKRKEQPLPESLSLLIPKIEIMQMVSNRLITSSHKYDWKQDSKGFITILHKLRRNRITPETFA